MVGGTRACPWWDQAPASTRGDPMYTNGSRDARRGFQSGTVVDRLAHKGPVDATASNLDTLLDRGFGRRVRMLLSFQRPSHLFGEGSSFPGHVHPSPISERTGKYSARTAARGRPAYRMARAGYRPWLRHARPPLAPSGGYACFGPRAGSLTGESPAGRKVDRARGTRDHERVATDSCALVARAHGPGTTRRRDKRLRQDLHGHGPPARTVVEVDQHDLLPGAERSCPSTIGIVSDGPMTAARRWAWEFVSWLRRLCS